MAFVRQYSLPTFNSLEATRPRVDSTQLKGCVRPQTFVDRHETFVTVCFETVHECLWTLERLEERFEDPELIRLNSKGCVRSVTVHECLWTAHECLWTVHECFVTITNIS